MVDYKKDSTVATVVTCAIVFCLFSFLYLYCYQTPTLAYEQHVLSGGVTVYYPLVSAIVITVVCHILQLVVYGFTKFSGASHALTYLPSMLLLSFITSGHPDGCGGLVVGVWLWFIPLILLLYFVAVKIIKQWINHVTPERFLQSRALVLNLLTLVVMMLFVFKVSNGDELFHRQVRAEKLLLENRYAELAKEGQGRSLLAQRLGMTALEKRNNTLSEHTDTTLTLLRFIALDKCGIIADSAFTQAVVGGVGSLMRLENVRPLLCSKRFLMRRKSFDYRLCALLAEKDLDTFARLLSQKVNVNDSTARDSLPRHFKEALVLYQHLRSKPVTAYVDPVLETDYNDMKQLLKNCATEEERRLTLHQSYKNNYWCYYAY